MEICSHQVTHGDPLPDFYQASELENLLHRWELAEHPCHTAHEERKTHLAPSCHGHHSKWATNPCAYATHMSRIYLIYRIYPYISMSLPYNYIHTPHEHSVYSRCNFLCHNSLVPSRNPWQCPFHLPNCWSFCFLLWLLLTQFRDLIASALAQTDWQNPFGIQLNISAMILMDGKAFRAGSAARISSNSSSFSLTGAAPCGPRGCRWWESGSPPHTSGAVGITHG